MHLQSATTVTLESPDQPGVITLISELDAVLYSLYPTECVYALDLGSLMQPNVIFAVARDGAGQAIGCGAVVLGTEFGEIKRVYVSPRGRGQGVARKIMAALEAQALEVGCKLLKLETGTHSHEAIALYTSSGYERRGPFGDYPEDPFSVFMQKRIAA